LDLSGETTFDNTVTLTETITNINTNYVSATKSNIGGQKKVTTAAAKVAKEILRDEPVTQCAFLYYKEREKAKQLRTNVPD
jgi:hypothetical protein